MIEQGHVVAQVNQGAHCLGSIVNLQSRSVIHQCRGAFSLSDEERQLEKLDNAVLGNLNKRYRGREHVASQTSKANLRGVSDTHARWEVGQNVVSARSAAYAAIGPVGKFAIELEVARGKRKRDAATGEELAHLRARRELMVARMQKSDDGVGGTANKVSSFRLDANERQRFDETYARVASTYTTAELESQFDASPHAPDEAAQDLIMDAMVDDDVRQRLPQWMRHIRQHRNAFLNTIIFVGSGGLPDVCCIPSRALEREFGWCRNVHTREFLCRCGSMPQFFHALSDYA